MLIETKSLYILIYLFPSALLTQTLVFSDKANAHFRPNLHCAQNRERTSVFLVHF